MAGLNSQALRRDKRRSGIHLDHNQQSGRGERDIDGSALIDSSGMALHTITNVSGLTLGGSAGSNYTLTGAGGLVTVGPLAVILTGTRSFDGSNDAYASILTIVNDLEQIKLEALTGSAILARFICRDAEHYLLQKT